MSIGSQWLPPTTWFFSPFSSDAESEFGNQCLLFGNSEDVILPGRLLTAVFQAFEVAGEVLDIRLFLN